MNNFQYRKIKFASSLEADSTLQCEYIFFKVICDFNSSLKELKILKR